MTGKLPIVVAGVALLVMGCSDTNIIVPTAPSSAYVTPTPLPGSPVPAPVGAAKIEFRVTGNALGARVRYATSTDGSSQVTTALPFVFSVSVAQQSSLFLSLDATPTGYSVLTTAPFMAVQIFVNGILFRESTSADFFLSTITASGTWRAQ
jgi:hypothetical protein